MSIALMNEVEALKKRMAAMEEIVRLLAVSQAEATKPATLKLKPDNRVQA